VTSSSRRRRALAAVLTLALVNLLLVAVVPWWRRGEMGAVALSIALGLLAVASLGAAQLRRQAERGGAPTDIGMLGGQPIDQWGDPRLRLAAAAARSGWSPQRLSETFDVPVAFAELLHAEAVTGNPRLLSSQPPPRPTTPPPPSVGRPTPRRAAGPALAVTAAGLLAGVTEQVLAGGGLVRADLRLAGWLAHHQVRWLHQLAYTVTLLGARGVLVVPLLLLAGWRARRDGTWRPLLQLVAALVVLAFTVEVFKLAVGRAAPGTGSPATGVGGLSFPSGHVADVMVLGALLVHWLGWDRLWRRHVVSAAAVVVGVALIYVHYHWASDVLAGLLAGQLIVTAGGRLLRLPAGRRNWARRHGAAEPRPPASG
jgi:undecaprenyl-diphosphatase